MRGDGAAIGSQLPTGPLTRPAQRRTGARGRRSLAVGALRTALFVADSRGSFRELAEVARLLEASGHWSCAICLAADGIASEGELRAHRAEGIACVDLLGEIYEPPSAQGAQHPLLRRSLARISRPIRHGARRFRALARSALPASVAAFLRRSRAWRLASRVKSAALAAGYRAVHLLERAASPLAPDAVSLRLIRTFGIAWQVQRRRLLLRWSRTLVRRVNADLVVLCEDNVEGVSAPVVRAAHEASAVVAILPNTIATATEPAETYWSHPNHALDSWSNRVVARLYPRWVHRHKGKPLLRLPAAGVLACEWMRLAPPLPWQINSGGADAILVESEAVRRYFARAGLPADRLRLTGTLAADRLARGMAEASQRRARLCDAAGFGDGKPLVLCALPPNQLDVRASACDFTSYGALLRFWVETLLAAGDCNLVLNLHPRSRREPVLPLEGPRVRIVDESVVDLIPACDLFVASVSATIRWAIACSKPVLNYDVYRYHYDDYAGVEGVVTIDDRDAFARAATRMLGDPEHLARLARRQADAAADWGTLDGRGGVRIARLFDELTARSAQEET